ncbi:MAG: hypothetical protein GFH27_549281n33 [Chloroflexi bacterium AL-W]|nr:hypothetical protein [Chloroflexi bacterium AL-N1]NOK65919.1 hypothetical protein [Chloroflexi bacterium AL-N10]NOK72800.1 hypothetical protein [Chloroflexi bacterium AL-N5]NOK79697.1 hypothetical protein [Chloroflexi bacterium AL-W]NOK93022.1 hypothetical protein [Chloroflexi bacterium AL-N15]
MLHTFCHTFIDCNQPQPEGKYMLIWDFWRIGIISVAAASSCRYLCVNIEYMHYNG